MTSFNSATDSDREVMEGSARNSLLIDSNPMVNTSVGNSAYTEGSRSSYSPNSFTFSIRPDRDAVDRDSLKLCIHGGSIALIKSRSEVLEKKIEGYLSGHRAEDKVLYAMPDYDIDRETIKWFITLLRKDKPEEGLVDLPLNQIVQIANLIYEFKCDVKPFEPLWYGLKNKFETLNTNRIRQIGHATRVATAAGSRTIATSSLGDLSGPDTSRLAYYQANNRGESSSANARRSQDLTHSTQVKYPLNRGQYFQYLILSVVFGDEEVFKSCFEEALLREKDLPHSHPQTFDRCCIPQLKEAQYCLLENAINHCQELWTKLESDPSKDVSKGFKKLVNWLEKSHPKILRFLRGGKPEYRSVHELVLDLTTNLSPSSNTLRNTQAHPKLPGIGRGLPPLLNTTQNTPAPVLHSGPGAGRGGFLGDVDWARAWARLWQSREAEAVASTFIKDLKPKVEIEPRNVMWTRLYKEYQELQQRFTERAPLLGMNLYTGEHQGE
jgi:hypothetical protein